SNISFEVVAPDQQYCCGHRQTKRFFIHSSPHKKHLLQTLPMAATNLGNRELDPAFCAHKHNFLKEKMSISHAQKRQNHVSSVPEMLHRFFSLITAALDSPVLLQICG
ncbi:hypothetical protein, partial [Deinococcus cellulosilyticus]|uniref:hypothetical protein n=1 Tax=Deinococcus cellulosilyticus TaxID=401558 RepID=UPI001C9A1D8E